MALPGSGSGLSGGVTAAASTTTPPVAGANAGQVRQPAAVGGIGRGQRLPAATSASSRRREQPRRPAANVANYPRPPAGAAAYGVGAALPPRSGSSPAASAPPARQPPQLSGLLSLRVPDPEAFVASPAATRTATASIARLAQVAVERVSVRLLLAATDGRGWGGRRLFLGQSQGTVSIDYTIRVPREAQATALAVRLRSTAVAEASEIYAEELARFGAPAAIVAAVRVVTLTAEAPAAEPLATLASDFDATKPSLQKGATKAPGDGGVDLAALCGVVGGVVGIFLLLRVVPWLWGRTHRWRRACGQHCAQQSSRRSLRGASAASGGGQQPRSGADCDEEVAARFCGICPGRQTSRRATFNI